MPAQHLEPYSCTEKPTKEEEIQDLGSSTNVIVSEYLQTEQKEIAPPGPDNDGKFPV